MSADSKQEGGTHYKKLDNRLQHWNVVAEMGWDYFIGNATKYLWRLGEKGGPDKAIEDIGKAIHYLEKKRELMRADFAIHTDTKIAESQLERAMTRKASKLKHPYGLERDPSREDWSEPGPGYVNQDR